MNPPLPCPQPCTVVPTHVFTLSVPFLFRFSFILDLQLCLARAPPPTRPMSIGCTILQRLAAGAGQAGKDYMKNTALERLEHVAEHPWIDTITDNMTRIPKGETTEPGGELGGPTRAVKFGSTVSGAPAFLPPICAAQVTQNNLLFVWGIHNAGRGNEMRQLPMTCTKPVYGLTWRVPVVGLILHQRQRQRDLTSALGFGFFSPFFLICAFMFLQIWGDAAGADRHPADDRMHGPRSSWNRGHCAWVGAAPLPLHEAGCRPNSARGR